MFKLILEQGDPAGKEFTLREGENLIGRSRESSIQLLADDVSSRQAQVIVRGSVVLVENLSRFGTWVNDCKLEGADKTELRPSQCIRVGKKYVLRLTEIGIPPTLAEDEHTHTGQAAMTKASVARSTAGGLASAPTIAPTGAVTTQDSADDLLRAKSLDSPSASPPADFDRVMRAKADAADLNEEQSESADGKTQARKTGFAPQEDIERRILQERARPRQRGLILLGVVSVISILFFLLRPKQAPEGKYEWDQTYPEDGSYPVTGGYSLVYPKNKNMDPPKTIDGGWMITTQLGRKRDVPLVITLREETDPRWALQESSSAMEEWMRANPDKIFDSPSSRFEGQQNGVRIWSVTYKRRSENDMLAGRASLFCNGRHLEILCVEIPVAGQARAENFLYYTYFDFPAEFEESHWEGHAPSANVSTAALMSQIRVDLRREAPATWAMIGRQLEMILTKTVAEKGPEGAEAEKEAVRLLVDLRKQQSRWYNSQQLQVINARRFGDKKRIGTLAQRCQAVFSDPSDRRYYEVRTWQQD